MVKGTAKRFIQRFFEQATNGSAITRRPAIVAEQLEGRRLLINTLSTVYADINDQISEAVSMTVGSSRNASISSADLSGSQPAGQDVDMYKVTAKAGQRVQFDVDRNSTSTLDSYLRLFNSSGTQLAANDDAAAPGETLGGESYLEYTFTTGGTYYFAVSGKANKSYNPVDGTGDVSSSTGLYSITLVDSTPLYTQTGTDPTWAQVLASGKLIIGQDSTTGVTGSTINVNNPYVETTIYSKRSIVQGIKIHTVGNSAVPRSDFSKWSRWYQEDGNTQVFRLFTGETNVRNDRPLAARIESFSNLKWQTGAWHEWSGTYRVIKPISTMIFQVKNDDNDWAVALNMSDTGNITLNRRVGTDEVIATGMTGKAFNIRVRDDGLNYEVYYNGNLAGTGSYARPTGSTGFRWGMYMGDAAVDRDAMIFVSGATVV